jgi:nucleotide-binding universal stress UspA family protein
MVMGSHGAKGISEKLIGSNAQYMIRNSKVPILVIKDNVERDIKKIVFASDFTDISNEAFSKLVAFAEIVGAHIDMLFVNTPKQKIDAENVESNMNKLADMVNANEGSVSMHQIDAETVETGVQTFANHNDTDMIAICTHGKSSLKQLFSPSIAETIANHTYLPLLSIRL